MNKPRPKMKYIGDEYDPKLPSLGGASIREQLQKTLIDYSLVRYPNENDEATLLDELVALIESITKEVIETPKNIYYLKGDTDEETKKIFEDTNHYSEIREELRAEQLERLAQLLGEKK